MPERRRRRVEHATTAPRDRFQELPRGTREVQRADDGAGDQLARDERRPDSASPRTRAQRQDRCEHRQHRADRAVVGPDSEGQGEPAGGMIAGERRVVGATDQLGQPAVPSAQHLLFGRPVSEPRLARRPSVMAPAYVRQSLRPRPTVHAGERLHWRTPDARSGRIPGGLSVPAPPARRDERHAALDGELAQPEPALPALGTREKNASSAPRVHTTGERAAND